jgi:short-subunit dehydrogenase
MAEQVQNVAVITGASSGIGRATALEFADKGYDVVLAARRIKELVKIGQECEELGVRAVVLALDVTDDNSMHKLRDTAVEAYGHIDVWINNAGVYLVGKFEDTPLEDMRKLMDVNFFGYVHGSHAALQQFRSQGYGQLINISSVNASAPQPYVGLYSASKAAVRALTESIRMELRLEKLDKMIQVCNVMPASIDTNLFQNGANYSGRQVQALEPVYDPAYVARKIYHLTERPRREIIIGPAGRVMALQNAHSPRMYEKRVGKFTDSDLLSDSSADLTPGNLYEPIENNTGTTGGWREDRTRADHLNIGLGLGLIGATLGAVAGAVLYNHRRSHS